MKFRGGKPRRGTSDYLRNCGAGVEEVAVAVSMAVPVAPSV